MSWTSTVPPSAWSLKWTAGSTKSNEPQIAIGGPFWKRLGYEYCA